MRPLRCASRCGRELRGRRVAARAANQPRPSRSPRKIAAAGMPFSSRRGRMQLLRGIGLCGVHRRRVAPRQPSATVRRARRVHRAGGRRGRARPRRRQTRRSSRPDRSHGERRTAAAGGLRVGIADHELRAVQALAVVHLRAHQVLQAQWIDQQGHVIGDDREVILALQFVEFESVLESRAAHRPGCRPAASAPRCPPPRSARAPCGRGGGERERWWERRGVGCGSGKIKDHALRMGGATSRFNRRRGGSGAEDQVCAQSARRHRATMRPLPRTSSSAAITGLAIASVHVNDCSTGAPPCGSSRASTRIGCSRREAARRPRPAGNT